MSTNRKQQQQPAKGKSAIDRRIAKAMNLLTGEAAKQFKAHCDEIARTDPDRWEGIAEILAESTAVNRQFFKDPFWDSLLKRRQEQQEKRRKREVLDPGKETIKAIERNRDPSVKEREHDRYARRVAEKTGLNAEMVRMMQDAERAERRVRKSIRDYLINVEGLSLSGAKKRMRTLTNEERQDELEHLKARAGLGAEDGATERRADHGKPAGEQLTPALPARDPVSEAQRITAQRDVNKAEVRSTLQEDMQRFIQQGGAVDQIDDWFPSDRNCVTIGGEKHIRPITFGHVQ